MVANLQGLAVTRPPSIVLPPARLLVHADEILEARRLHARVYVQIGYLTPEDIGPDQTARIETDPWTDHCRYYGAFDADGRVRATLRLIPNDAPWPLPTLQLPGVDPATRQHLTNLPAGRVGEISALARDPHAGMPFTRAAFRALWLDSLDCEVTEWVLNVDTLVLRNLRSMDQDLFRVIGSPCPAPVRPVLPVWARPTDVQASIFTNGLNRRVVTLP